MIEEKDLETIKTKLKEARQDVSVVSNNPVCDKLIDHCKAKVDMTYEYHEETKELFVYVKRSTKSVTKKGTEKALSQVQAVVGDSEVTLEEDGIKLIKMKVKL